MKEKLTKLYLDSLYKRGQIYISIGYYDKGIDDFDTALNLINDKNDSFYLFILFEKYLSSIRYRKIPKNLKDEIKNILTQIPKNKRLYIDFLDLLASVESEEGNHEKAIKLYKKEFNLLRDKKLAFDILGKIASNYYLYGDYKKALYYQKKANNLMTNNNKLVNIVNHSRFGIIYFGMGKYKEALKHIEKTYRLSKEIGYPLHELKALNNMGILYYKFGELKKSITYFKRYLALSQKIGYSKKAYIAYINIGVSYKNLNDFKNSEKYYKKAIEYTKKSNDIKGQVLTYTNLSSLYMEMNDYKKAKEAAFIAYQLVWKIKDRKNMLFIMDNILNILYYEKANPKIIKKMLDKEENLMNKLGIYNFSFNLLKSKSLYFSYIKDWDNFFKTLNQMLEYIINEELDHHFKTIFQFIDLMDDENTIKYYQNSIKNILAQIQTYLQKNNSKLKYDELLKNCNFISVIDHKSPKNHGTL